MTQKEIQERLAAIVGEGDWPDCAEGDFHELMGRVTKSKKVQWQRKWRTRWIHRDKCEISNEMASIKDAESNMMNVNSHFEVVVCVCRRL